MLRLKSCIESAFHRMLLTASEGGNEYRQEWENPGGYLSYRSPLRPSGHELGANPAQDLIGYTHMRCSLSGPSSCAAAARSGSETAAVPAPQLVAPEGPPSSEEVPKLAALPLAWLWWVWSRTASSASDPECSVLRGILGCELRTLPDLAASAMLSCAGGGASDLSWCG